MRVLRSLTPLLFVLLLFTALPAAAAGVGVVYDIDDTASQATKMLRNLRNHLDVAPDTKIVVVAHGEGVDFLFDGAKDEKNHVDYGPLIADLKNRGVDFEVCQVTMKRRNLKREQFVMEATFTPSGVVRIGELQVNLHYAYIKP